MRLLSLRAAIGAGGALREGADRQRPHDRRHGRDHGQIRRRTLLCVDDAHLHRAPVEARDRAARVRPLVVEHSLRVVGREISVDPAEDLRLVLRLGESWLGHHQPGDRGDPARVAPIRHQTRVERRSPTAVEERGARRQRGDQRKDQADRGVQAPELVVTVEGEVQVRALQVRPAVARTAEDAVEGVVDLRVLVGPELGLGVGIHPGVHRPGHEPRAHVRKLGVGAPHAGVELGHEPRQGWCRAVRLELEHMQRELVRPGDGTELHLGLGRAGHALHQSVAFRPHGQRVPIDDHRLDLDAVRLEQTRPAPLGQDGGGLAPVVAHARRSSRPRRSSRTRNQRISSSQSASLRIPSS